MFSHRRLLHSYIACYVSGRQKHTSELFPSVSFHCYKSKRDVGQHLKKCQSVLRVMLLTGENKGHQGKQTETGYIRKQKEVQKQDNVTNIPFPSLRTWGAGWGAVLCFSCCRQRRDTENVPSPSSACHLVLVTFRLSIGDTWARVWWQHTHV